MILNRDSILGMQDLEMEAVEVPEWGGSVKVRALSNSDIKRINKLAKNESTQLDAMVLTVALSVVDDEGNRIFEDKDVDKLAQKSFSVITRLSNVCTRLSGLDIEDAKKD